MSVAAHYRLIVSSTLREGCGEMQAVSSQGRICCLHVHCVMCACVHGCGFQPNVLTCRHSQASRAAMRNTFNTLPKVHCQVILGFPLSRPLIAPAVLCPLRVHSKSTVLDVLCVAERHRGICCCCISLLL